MSRESKIEGISMSFRSSGPQMRGYILDHYQLDEVADLLKLMGIKKDEMKGAMALVEMIRRPIR